MNIDKYIAELLYDFECVTIPGFGAFIANDRPAEINRINHQFKPPFRNLIFNVQLQSNDGLLVNQLASSEGISFNKANYLIDVFVKKCFNRLALGKVVELHNIGRLFYDENQYIVFQQDNKVNYYKDSFGLKSFVSPPVKREKKEEIIGFVTKPKAEKAKPVDRKPRAKRPEKKKKRKVVLPLLATLIILMLGFGWAVTNQEETKNYLQNTASLFPFLHTEEPLYSPRTVSLDDASLNEMEKVENADYEPVRGDDDASVVVSDKSDDVAVPVELPLEKAEKALPKENVVTPDVSPTKVVPEPVKSVRASKQYYIIAGSFSSFDNASSFVKELKVKGYNAMIADTSKSKMFRVAYDAIEGLAPAKEKLFAIREEDNPDAWILRK